MQPKDISCVIGAGSSLTDRQLELVHDSGIRVVVVNNGFMLAPWADHLHGCDPRWWRWWPNAIGFAGTKSITRPLVHEPDWDEKISDLVAQGVEVLQQSGDFGFDPRPGYVRTGSSGGFQMVHREIQRGARLIILLGMDMHGRRWHDDHPDTGTTDADYEFMARRFHGLLNVIEVRGIEVVNCSPGSKLDAFRHAPLSSILRSYVPRMVPNAHQGSRGAERAAARAC